MSKEHVHQLVAGNGMRRRRVRLWQEIATSLRDEIVDGAFVEGQRLPTESQLSDRFGANRHTIRRAVASLVEAGLVIVKQGDGTFVRSQIVEYPVGPRTRFSENLRPYAPDAPGVLMETKKVSANRGVANALQVSSGTPCLCMTALRYSDGAPFGLTDHWYSDGKFAQMPTLFDRYGSISVAYRSLGIEDYQRRETRVSARLPKTREAELLNIPRTRPLIVTRAINVDMQGCVIEYGVTRFSGDRTEIVFES